MNLTVIVRDSINYRDKYNKWLQKQDKKTKESKLFFGEQFEEDMENKFYFQDAEDEE